MLRSSNRADLAHVQCKWEEIWQFCEDIDTEARRVQSEELRREPSLLDASGRTPCGWTAWIANEQA